MDMSATIQPKSDQLNADSLLAGPRTIKITAVTGNPSSAEQPVSVAYEGDDGKPFKPCKSMRRVMVHAWGPDARAYVGRSMMLFCDPEVRFGGMTVGGIRISHMSDIDGTLSMLLTATKGKRAPFVVRPLQVGDWSPAVALAQVASLTTEADATALWKRTTKAPDWVDVRVAITKRVAEIKTERATVDTNAVG